MAHNWLLALISRKLFIKCLSSDIPNREIFFKSINRRGKKKCIEAEEVSTLTSCWHLTKERLGSLQAGLYKRTVCVRSQEWEPFTSVIAASNTMAGADCFLSLTGELHLAAEHWRVGSILLHPGFRTGYRGARGNGEATFFLITSC